MTDPEDRFACLVGRAAIEVWGDMPRDIQETLFETAMIGRDVDREELARLLHDRHPRTAHPASPRAAQRRWNNSPRRCVILSEATKAT